MQKKDKDFYMSHALGQAEKALGADEVPVGAVVVDQEGRIIGRGYNKIETNQCQLGHAEAVAIQRACKKKTSWRLNGCSIYVTLEPCLMCLGLIRLSRLDCVIYGAQSPEFGGTTGYDKKGALFVKELVIEGGIKEEQSTLLLKSFFGRIREKRKVDRERKTRCT